MLEDVGKTERVVLVRWLGCNLRERMTLELLLEHSKQTVHLDLIFLRSYPEQVAVLNNPFLLGVGALRHLFGSYVFVVVICVLLDRLPLFSLAVEIANVPDVKGYLPVPPELLPLALHGTLGRLRTYLRLNHNISLIDLADTELVDEQHIAHPFVSYIIEHERAQSQERLLYLSQVHDLAEHSA